MSTAAQIYANQQNATRSTGPRTPEGKKTSSTNATRHGLTGNFRLLPGEDPDKYLDLLANYEAEFEPATGHESFLVTQMTEARWKLERIERLQAEAFDQLIAAGDQTQSPDARLVAALNQSSPALDRLQRYAAQTERTYHRAHRELSQLRRQCANRSAALDARLERVLFAPVPNHPRFEEYRAVLRNEANPAAAPALDRRPALRNEAKFLRPTPVDDRALRL